MAKVRKELSPDPDRLIRQSAGVYRSEDERFEVRQSDTAWYLVDLERSNDFGQELIHGPLATLKEVREAIPGARKVTPLPKAKLTAAARRAAAAEPERPPKSWIDQLPETEAKVVRRLISALEREGIKDAEDWVRDSRGEGGRSLAVRLIEHRLEAIAAEAEPDERRRAQDLIRRTVRALTEDGALPPEPLPRWAVVEIEAGGQPPPRRLRPKL